jgi:hypothetical protein
MMELLSKCPDNLENEKILEVKTTLETSGEDV